MFRDPHDAALAVGGKGSAGGLFSGVNLLYVPPRSLAFEPVLHLVVGEVSGLTAGIDLARFHSQTLPRIHPVVESWQAVRDG